MSRILRFGNTVELCLDRQKKVRRKELERSGLGHFGDWPDNEVRMSLAYLAFKSQQRGAYVGSFFEDEARRVVWQRAEALRTMREQHEKGEGRFVALDAGDAEELLRSLLHHSGLLVELAGGHQVQFADLETQDYLAALFLHERYKVKGEAYLESEIWSQLVRPGWQAVGHLLLGIHSEATNREGHFRMLDMFDLCDPDQARLFVSATSSQELSFRAKERLSYLPRALAAALVHPQYGLASSIGKQEDWRSACRELIITILDERDLTTILSSLLEKEGAPARQRSKMIERWMSPKYDFSWEVSFDDIEARAQAVVSLVADLGTCLSDETPRPISAEFEGRLAVWLLFQVQLHGSRILWQRRAGTGSSMAAPVPTNLCKQLHRLMSTRGTLFEAVVKHEPVDTSENRPG